jgi:hypothetical protein
MDSTGYEAIQVGDPIRIFKPSFSEAALTRHYEHSEALDIARRPCAGVW